MRRRMNHMMFAVLARELLAGASCERLVEASGLHIETVRALVRESRERGVTIIGKWDTDSRGAYTVRVHRFRLSKFEQDATRPVSDATLDRRRYPIRNGKRRTGERPATSASGARSAP